MGHLDLSYLRENVSDDEEFLKQLLQVFLESSTEDIADLEKSVASGEHERIKRAAHKVKSSFRSLGMKRLTDLLQNMEDLAHDKRPLHELEDIYDGFRQQYPEVKEEVEAVLFQGK